jgi:hypothetical protein
MSNQRKVEFVNGIFIYNISGEVMAKFCQNPDLCRKVKSVQISPIQQHDQVPMAIARKLLTICSKMMNHRKSERVTNPLGIRQFRSFRFA